MSVFIKGMEMPQKCGQCKLFHAEQPMYCIVDKNYRTVGAPYGMPRPDWCPLVEVKEPHGDLADKDKLNIHDISPVDGFCVMGVTEEDIELADTVIEGSEI
jgi:hypothetical protein